MTRSTVRWMNSHQRGLDVGTWSQIHGKRDNSRTICGEVFPGRRYLQLSRGEITCLKCQRQLALGEGKGWRRKERDWPPAEAEIAEQLALFKADGGVPQRLPDGVTPERWEVKPKDRQEATNGILWDEMIELQAMGY